MYQAFDLPTQAEFEKIRHAKRAYRGTVAFFAQELKKGVDVLLRQLKSAGVHKEDGNCQLTDLDKHQLLKYLQDAHRTAATERKRITLVKSDSGEKGQACKGGSVITKANSDYARLVQSFTELQVLPTFPDALAHYQLIRRNGAISSLSQAQVDKALLHAFFAIHSRNPDQSELEELVDLSDRLSRQFDSLHPGRPIDLLRALSESQLAVSAHLADVLIQAVFVLVHYGREGSRREICYFKARSFKAPTNTQIRLRIGNRRIAQANIASSSWRLLRMKHFLPARAATISLA